MTPPFRAPFRVVRNVLFWFHLSAGVIAGIVILVMSVTGVVLAFEQQILAAVNRSYAQAAPAGSKRLTASELVEKAKGFAPRKDLAPTTLTMYADAGRPVLVSFGREGNVYLDPVTGTGGPAKGAAFFRWNTDLHRWVLTTGDMRKFGKSVTGVSNLAFLFIVLSGVVLWLPPAWKWAVVKLHVVPSARLKGKARDWNWHNALGLWAFVPLVIIVPAGVMISYPWAVNLVYWAAGEKPGGTPVVRPVAPSMLNVTGAQVKAVNSTPPATQPYVILTERGMDLDRAVELASGFYQPWNAMSFPVPKGVDKSIAFTLDRGTGRQPQHKATLTVFSSGEYAFETAAARPKGTRWRTFLRFAHTGEYFGLVGQFVGLLACLAACVLTYTGIALSVRRGWNWWRRKTPAAPANS